MVSAPQVLLPPPPVSIFKKQLDRQWFEIFPAAPVQFLFPFIDMFSLHYNPRLFIFPLSPNTDQRMWLLLALVANSTINK